MFSVGIEGLNIRPPRVGWPSAVFTYLLVCVLYTNKCSGYTSFKGSSELTPCVLMIVWASDWRASKLCIRLCRNRRWRLPLRALRHHMWNSPNMLTICCVRWRNPRVWTNANEVKDFVKVKTYSDLIVLKQDAHDKLGEPPRWVLYVSDFDKSTYPAMDKAREEEWMNMYSILDRSTFEERCVRSDQGIAGRFPSHELSDRRSTDWIRGQCF